MFVEIFAICDAATDYGGRLNLLGVFEGIAAPHAPVARERCSIALRLRFEAGETGEHSVAVRIVHGDGRLVMPEMNARMGVKIAAGRSSGAFNLVLNLNGIRFETFGLYQIELLVDGELKTSLPLLVAQTKRRGVARSPMDN